MSQKHTPTPWQIIENIAPYTAKIDIYPVNAKAGTPLKEVIIARTSLNVQKTNCELQGIGALNDAVNVAEANAEFITRACNAHDDLVAALESLVADWDARLENCETVTEVREFSKDTGLIGNARAALAKAKGVA